MTSEAKVAIVGAGRVGSTLAYSLVTNGSVRDIVLIDASRERAEGEAMDIAHAVSFHTPVSIVPGELADTAGAAITVIAAGAAQRVGETRPELFQRNADMLKRIVPEVARINPDGLLILATNPVDALTYLAVQLAGLPAGRVFGSGTVLDTARLRAELANYFHVDPRNVHAYVLGEHGDSEFVAWSSGNMANLHFDELCRLTGMCSTSEQRSAIEERVRNAAYEIIRRKGGTNFAIASALTKIIEAVLRDEASVFTVSSPVDGHYGIRDVALSLPAIVDRTGVRQVLPVGLSDEEQSRLRASAAAVRKTLESLQ
ncbi:L-lactate dehydrogenase [Paucimonas lemoignei]|uniref:L-lactate dehydrogenase n=2 Tax=Paucimonas lemoignei TaxID=29443 RepID=A0A4R3I0Q5_PAULE|nr:L-lactate dehydrogenase [Paucimonas lemoignei]